jgi:hypothetical protein
MQVVASPPVSAPAPAQPRADVGGRRAWRRLASVRPTPPPRAASPAPSRVASRAESPSIAAPPSRDSIGGAIVSRDVSRDAPVRYGRPAPASPESAGSLPASPAGPSALFSDQECGAGTCVYERPDLRSRRFVIPRQSRLEVEPLEPTPLWVRVRVPRRLAIGNVGDPFGDVMVEGFVRARAALDFRTP